MPLTPFEELQAASPYRALFRDRTPDPGECVVVSIDWETPCTAALTNGAVRWSHVDIADLFLWRKPDPTDPLEKLRPFLLTEEGFEISPGGDALATVTELYKRVRLADDIRRVEESTSWDYCKQASLDWLRKKPRWIPIHEEAYYYQLNCVPPHYWQGDVMMVGEAHSGDFHLTTFCLGKQFYCCLLTKRMVLDEKFMRAIPFADELPMLGVPEPAEAD